MLHSKTILALMLLSAFAATAAQAQSWTSSSNYNGYGAGTQNTASNYQLRDPNGTIWEYAAELKESNDFLSAKTLNTRDSEIKCSEPMAEAYLALCTELEQAKADRNRIGQQMRSEYLAEVAQVFAALPSTFYADRPLPERVQLMVSHWQKAVEMVNHDGAAPE